MSLVFLCAGQASQVVGMGRDLTATCDACRSLFDAADRALGFSLSRLMFEGPARELRRTAVAQPAILALSVAHGQHLVSLGMVPHTLAGHSLGQYSALVLAGSLAFEDAVRLVAVRGRLMQETVPEGQGAMAAIVGLDREQIYAACDNARSRGVVNVACHNAPGQTVISGLPAAVSAAAEYCEDLGGGVVPLEVSAPFHCDLLAPMVQTFACILDTMLIKDPLIPVMDNVTAQPLLDARAVRRSLVRQITAPVLFEESLYSLVSAGATRFVQCGPGNSLLSFARRVTREAEFDTFDAALQRPGAVPQETGSHVHR